MVNKSLTDILENTIIMVVDDDAMVLDIVVEHLRNFGFKHILTAKDGKAALKQLHDPHQRIDLILSDWEMPFVDGHTLLRAVRKHPTKSNTKFVMVTSQNSRERIKITQAKQLNVDAYIVKPFRGDLLREKIFDLLGYKPGDKKTG